MINPPHTVMKIDFQFSSAGNWKVQGYVTKTKRKLEENYNLWLKLFRAYLLYVSLKLLGGGT